MRFVICAVAVLCAVALSAAGCSCLKPSLKIPGEVNNTCPSEVVFDYSMTCNILATSERQCIVNGELTNTGDGTARGVKVNVNWKYSGELFFYQDPWPPVDDLPPQDSADSSSPELIGYSLLIGALAIAFLLLLFAVSRRRS